MALKKSERVVTEQMYVPDWPSAQIILWCIHFPPQGFASQPQLLAEHLAVSWEPEEEHGEHLVASWPQLHWALPGRFFKYFVKHLVVHSDE